MLTFNYFRLLTRNMIDKDIMIRLSLNDSVVVSSYN